MLEHRFQTTAFLQAGVLVLASLFSGVASGQVETAPAKQPTNANRPTPVLELKFASLPGPGADRQVLVQFHRTLAMLKLTPPDKIQWQLVLENLEDILQLPEDQYLELASAANQLPIPGRQPRLRSGSSRSLWATIDQLIGEFPREGRRAWLARNAETSAVQLKAAIASGDIHEVSRVARQFVHTPAGYAAAERIGIHHLDRGSTALAIRQFEKLRTSPQARVAREPMLTLKTAAAWAALGRDDRSYEMLIDLDGWLDQHQAVDRSAFPLLVRPLAERVKLLKKLALHADVDGYRNSLWSHFLGNAKRNGQAEFSPVGAVLWESSTNGFHAHPTNEDRAKFTPEFVAAIGETDIELFAESEAEMVAFFEAGLKWLNDFDLNESQWHLPAGYPVIADGLAIFRTYNRIRAVELATGDLRWESFMVDPAWEEQFDVGTAERATMLPKQTNDPRYLLNPLNQRQLEFQRIRSRHDRTTGTLTTDGRLVFFIEDCGIPSRLTSTGQTRMQQTAPLPWNRLCCAELESGILLWELGGPGDRYPLPGADHFFLGPPTIIGGHAYVLGERDGQVRLFCLQPDSGEIVWSQDIAVSGSPARVDALRRTSGASPTEASGLLICPLVDGMVIAFDPDLRRIAWTWRYKSRPAHPMGTVRRGFRFGRVVPSVDLPAGERWRDLSVVNVGGLLLITPPDADELFCLDVVSGQPVWSRPRGSALYLASVMRDRAVLVETDAIRAVSLVDGAELWRTELIQRHPSGRGVRTGSVYHLPLLIMPVEEAKPAGDHPRKIPGGAIAAFDLRNGRLLVETEMPDGRAPGNLVGANGRLVSQRYDQVIALPSLSEAEDRLASRLAEKADDGEALGEVARLRLHQGRVTEAIDLLKRALLTDSQSSLVQMVIQTVRLQLQSSDADENELLELLETVPLSTSDRIAVTNVRADVLIDRGQFADAFKLIAETPVHGNGQPALVAGKSMIQAGPQWRAGRLAGIYARVPAGQLSTFLGFEPRPTSEENMREWLGKFGSSSHAARAVRLRLARSLDPKTDLLEIESLISTAKGHDENAEAEIALNEAWLQAGHGRAVAANIDAFRRRWSGKSLPQNRTADQVVAAWQQHETILQLPKTFRWPLSATVKINDAPVEKEGQTNQPGNQPEFVPVEDEWEFLPVQCVAPAIDPPSPVVDGWLFVISSAGVTARDSLGRDVWMLSPEEFGDVEFPVSISSSGVSYACDGHLLVIMLRTGVSVFDLSAKHPQRLWSRPFAFESMPAAPQIAQRPGERSMFMLRRPFRSIVGLAAGCLVYWTAETLHAVDATTGNLLWRLNGVPVDSSIFGDGRYLNIVASEGGRVSHLTVRDVHTGHVVRDVSIDPAAAVESFKDFRLTGYAGRNLIGTRLAKINVPFLSLDVMSGNQLWEHTLTAQTGFWISAGRHLAVGLDIAGQLKVCDTRTGELIVDEAVPATGRLQSMAVHETDFGFVLFADTRLQRLQQSMPNVHHAWQAQLVRGTAYGVDCRAGKVLWSTELPDQYVSLPQPRDLPFVLLNSQRSNGAARTQESKTDFPLDVLDTRTGQTIASLDEQTSFNDFRPTVDLDRREITIRLGERRSAVISYGDPGESEPATKKEGTE
jgi:outer membrane protein assembly factor BamB/thioredoxin-like negative regulator of GroEL